LVFYEKNQIDYLFKSSGLTVQIFISIPFSFITFFIFLKLFQSLFSAIIRKIPAFLPVLEL